MNKITKKYMNLTNNSNEIILCELEKLTNNLDKNNIKCSLFDTGYQIQFRCNIGKNLKLYFNANGDNNIVIDAAFSLNKEDYIHLHKVFFPYNANNAMEQDLIDYFDNSTEEFNGKISNSDGVYRFEKKNGMLDIYFYSINTLNDMVKRNSYINPDNSISFKVDDIDIFALANYIILDNSIIFNVNYNNGKKKIK